MQNLKIQFKIKVLYFLFVVFIFLFLGFNFCQAVVLYLEPSNGDYQPGDTFLTEIKIDTQECINIVEANLSFSQDILDAINFSQGESILTIWIKPPTIDQSLGLISFIGGIPGGYCGKIPGDPGPSNLLGKIIFRIPEITVREVGENIAKVKFLESSQVLLNDMLGTKAKLTTQGAEFKILSEKSEIPKDEWQKELEKDNIPPEPFEIEIHQDSLIFEGKYFIIFSTTDKQTGIDYYEIREGKRDWKKVSSPYLLEDQSLKSKILVRAVDKAKNERIAEYAPPISKKPFLYPYWIFILILIGIGIWHWLYKKSKIKYKY